MKPIDSPQDRAITVRAFINARYNKLVRITDYSPMVTYLNGKHIEVLYEKLPKTATKQGKWVSTGYRDGYYEAIHIYDANDAEMYFEWLISTVQGSQNSSDEIRAKAYDQLCRFILILADVTEWKQGYILAKPYDWINRLEAFESKTSESIQTQIKEINETLKAYDNTISGHHNELNEIYEKLEEGIYSLNNTSDKHMSDVVRMLELVTTWMERYAPMLDAMDKDYKALHPTKVKK